jgi:hypothetical protein
MRGVAAMQIVRPLFVKARGSCVADAPGTLMEVSSSCGCITQTSPGSISDCWVTCEPTELAEASAFAVHLCRPMPPTNFKHLRPQCLLVLKQVLWKT